MDKIPQTIDNNNQELQKQLRELQLWRQEMENKEKIVREQAQRNEENPPVRSKKAANEIPNEKESRIKSTDYESWENFDDKKACEKVDKEDKGPTSKDGIESEMIKKVILNQEAIYEKEKGNNFVKQKKWDEAISCYNRAIELKDDDAIFYANRGLCFLKKENFHAAEADCSKSLSLDPTYIKALQRRSCAREYLGYLRSAATDLAEIMRLEPDNQFAKKHHVALIRRMGTKGPNSKSSSPAGSQSSSPTHTPLIQQAISDVSPNATIEIKPESSGRSLEEILGDLKYDQPKNTEHQDREDDSPRVPPTSIPSSSTTTERPYMEPHPNYQHKRQNRKNKKQNDPPEEHVQPVIKPPHLRSQKPLYRIPINEIPKGFSASPCSLKDTANGVTKLIAKHINQRPKFGQNPVAIPYEEYLKRLRFREEKETASKAKAEPPKTTEALKTTDAPKTAEAPKTTEDPKITELPKTAEAGASQKSQGHKGRNKKPKQSPPKPVVAELQADTEKYENLISDIPKTSVQFITQWRLLQDSEEYRSKYLKNIIPKDIPVIFKNSMEAEILTDILKVIEKGADFVKDGDVKSYPYMKYLTEVKRFSALSMFLSNDDKQVVRDILTRCKNKKECTEKEMQLLLGKYEIIN